MLVATIVVSGVLAALLVLTAARKLSHREPVVASYQRVGVPEDKLNYLATILLAGAAGLLLGLWWPPVGIAAGIGLVGYFLAAIGFHVRAHDSRNLPTPAALLALAAAALILRVVTTG